MSTDRRRVNDDRLRLFGSDAARMIAFVCECGDDSCRRTVLLTESEYTAQQPGLVLHAVHDDDGTLTRTLN